MGLEEVSDLPRLRRYRANNECKLTKDAEGREVFAVKAKIFRPDLPEISFHLRPVEWSDEEVDGYRRAYPNQYTIPGVLQASTVLFKRASIAPPLLKDDETDLADYRHLHCAWQCPSQKAADELAATFTTALESRKEARVVFHWEGK